MNIALRTRGQILIALCAALAALFAFASSARAATYCVGNPACAGTNFTTIPLALAQAAINSGTDRIEVSSGTYTDGPWTIAAGNEVQMMGVGATKPVLAPVALGAGETAVLVNDESGSKFENLAIVIPSAMGTKAGLLLNETGDARDITVTGPASSGETGIKIDGNSTSLVTGANVNLPSALFDESTGVDAYAAGSMRVENSTIAAGTGVRLVNSANVGMHRLNVSSNTGVAMTDSSATVSSSLVKRSGTSGGGEYGMRVISTDGSAGIHILNCFNNTLIGNASPGTGVSAETTAGGSVTINVSSSIVTGWATSFGTSLAGGGAATMPAVYSRYDSPGAATPGAGSSAISGDLGFNDEAGGDYAPRRTSALVDAGDPSALNSGSLPLPSARDLAGNDRIINGIGAGGDVRDIGAYELPNRPPTANITVETAAPQTGSPVAFSAAGSTEPDGDGVSYLWSFDDGATASGPTTQHVFQTAIVQTVRLTVTDSTGLASTASVQVDVKKGMLALALPKAAVTVNRSGSFKYRLGCPGAAVGNCGGRLLFMTMSKIDLKRYSAARGSVKRKLKAAQYIFTIEAGKTKTLSIRTYKTFQNALGRKGKIVVIATATGHADNVDLVGAPTIFTIKRPR